VPNSILLDVIKTDPFIIKRQIKKFIYELDFPKNMKIYPFFSIIHFETIEDNSYDRFNPPSTPIIIDKEQTHLIDRIFRERKTSGTE
jgi:hypothetical protein